MATKLANNIRTQFLWFRWIQFQIEFVEIAETRVLMSLIWTN